MQVCMWRSRDEQQQTQPVERKEAGDVKDEEIKYRKMTEKTKQRHQKDKGKRRKRRRNQVLTENRGKIKNEIKLT